MSSPTLGRLAWLVARDANRTVGGGLASMELLRRSFGARGWLSASEHGLLVAVSRLTPGTNVLAYCAALGWTRLGGPGAIAALLAGSVPSSVIVLMCSSALERIDQWPAVQAALGVATLVASLLVLAAAWQLLRPHVTGSRRVWTTVAIALALGLSAAGTTPVRILLVLAAYGALTPVRESRAA